MQVPRLTLEKICAWLKNWVQGAEIIEQEIRDKGVTRKRRAVRYLDVDKNGDAYFTVVFEKSDNVFFARSLYGESHLLDSIPCLRKAWNEEMHGLIGGCLTENGGKIYIEDNMIAHGADDQLDETFLLFLWQKISNTREKLNTFFATKLGDDNKNASDQGQE